MSARRLTCGKSKQGFNNGSLPPAGKLINHCRSLKHYRSARLHLDARSRAIAASACWPGLAIARRKGSITTAFKLGVRVSRIGMITDYPLLSASPHDINHLGALIEGHEASSLKTLASLMTINNRL